MDKDLVCTERVRFPLFTMIFLELIFKRLASSVIVKEIGSDSEIVCSCSQE